MKALFKNMQGKASAGIQLLAVALTVGVLAMVMFAPHGLKNAMADTTNLPPGTSVYAIPIHLSGTNSASLSGVAAIKMPYGARLLGFTGMSRATTGPTTTMHTVDLRAGATSVLSSPLGLSTVGVTEATIATAAIADETTLFVDLNLGTLSTVLDTTLLMTFVR